MGRLNQLNDLKAIKDFTGSQDNYEINYGIRGRRIKILNIKDSKKSYSVSFKKLINHIESIKAQALSQKKLDGFNGFNINDLENLEGIQTGLRNLKSKSTTDLKLSSKPKRLFQFLINIFNKKNAEEEKINEVFNQTDKELLEQLRTQVQPPADNSGDSASSAATTPAPSPTTTPTTTPAPSPTTTPAPSPATTPAPSPASSRSTTITDATDSKNLLTADFSGSEFSDDDEPTIPKASEKMAEKGAGEPAPGGWFSAVTNWWNGNQ